MNIETLEPLDTLTLDTPVGRLTLRASAEALVAIDLPGAAPARAGGASRTGNPVLRRAAAQLTAWLAGERRDFDLPLAPRGTRFQRAVWRELSRIPYGETRSYGELARALGRPEAARAVGAANGKNPLPIVLPCHRVIGAGGALTGYAGGLAMKRWLLEHEARRAR